jgi:hypothetical protein
MRKPNHSLGSMAFFLATCRDSAKIAGVAFGPNPTPPEPTETIIPTINFEESPPCGYAGVKQFGHC